MTSGTVVLVVVMTVLVCRGVQSGGSDLYLSTAETALLLESEPHLLGFVHGCLTRAAHSTGNAEFTRLAGELRAELNSLPAVKDARHPLDAYVGLRRFTQYWGHYIAKLDPLVAHSVESSLAKNKIVFPDQEVLQQARRAIVRLQASYSLSPAALITSAGSNLTAADLASLATASEGLGFPHLAEGWRGLAVSQPPVHQAVGQTGHSSDISSAEYRETQYIHAQHAEFFSLCQRYRNSTDLAAIRSERCEYRAGRRTLPWNRWKTEVLRSEPPVLLFYDFISDREANVLINQAMDNLQQAHTGPTLNRSVLRVHRRLGKIAWLREGRSRTLQRLTGRIEAVTGLHAVYRPQHSFGEDFQVVNYGIGGHYIPHYDYFKARDAFTEAEMYLKDSGDRAATFMIYLGEVTEGGATVFPRLGVGAPPVKRAALFWYNFTPDGTPDSRSLHGGCPVIIGQKWVANKWIHEMGTAMTKSCHTTPWTPPSNT